MGSTLPPGLLLIAMGVVTLPFAIKRFHRAQASQHWPQVQGVITKSKASVGLKRSVFSIGYNYEVKGKKFSGDEATLYTLTDHHYVHLAETVEGAFPTSVEFIKSMEQSKKFAAFFARAPYKKGESVPVYYNPEKPNQAVLIRGASPDKPYSEIYLSGFTLVLGVFFILLAIFSSL